MGGYYIPLIQGEIYGFQIGLLTDLMLWEHTRKLDYSKRKGEWLVGYGVGFTKGQNIRNQIKEHSIIENLDSNTRAVLFLQKRIFNYGDFQKELNVYLKNIKNWHVSKIENNSIINANKLLLENKLQRSLDFIANYYTENFKLVTLMKFYPLQNQLSIIRMAKQKQEIDNESYLVQKQEIQSKFEKWLKKEQD